MYKNVQKTATYLLVSFAQKYAITYIFILFFI